MKLWTIKFANGEYLTRKRDALTADLNDAYVYHDKEYLVDQLELKRALTPETYDKLVTTGADYKIVEVKIVEA